MTAEIRPGALAPPQMPVPPAPVMDGPEAPRIAPPSLATTARANDLQPPY